jgi:hypothetical protein
MPDVCSKRIQKIFPKISLSPEEKGYAKRELGKSKVGLGADTIMHVLVACEYSGRVRDAFTKKGHTAISCDLLEGETPGPHYKMDVRDCLNDGWDLMIAHPPCTHLAVSGARWFKGKEKEQAKAIDFFFTLAYADIPRICIENPIGIMSTHYRKPDQIIQPWQFGHGETKATCLWLKGLQKIVPTSIIQDPEQRRGNLTPSGQNKLGPSPDRWKMRSLTYQGIASAMAEQWG